MSRLLVEEFGSSGIVNTNKNAVIASGVIDDGSAVDIVLDAGGIYELFTAEFNASTGAYRGHRSRLIKTPEEDLYGTVASATINESASTNSGVTITMNSDSSISIARSSATYSVRYFVRAVGLNTGIGGGDGGTSPSSGNVPIGGTTGQILAKASDANYDTEWVDNNQPATDTPLMDGTADAGSSDKFAREDHVHPHDSLICNKNLLDNWYFVGGGSQQGYGIFPVNQRGQTIYTKTGTSLVRMFDRWFIGGNNISNDNVTVTLASGGVTVSRGANCGTWNLAQNLSYSKFLRGKTVTLSGLFTSVSGTVDLIIDQYNGSTSTIEYSSSQITSAGLVSMTTTLTNDFTRLQVFVRNNNGSQASAFTVTAMKLELGNTQTLAHQESGNWVLNEVPSFDEQMTKCLRYFFCTSQNDDVACYGYLTDSGKVYNMRLAMPVRMVGHPTATMTSWWARGANGYSAYASVSSPATPTSLQCYREGGTNQFCNIIAINDRLSSTAPDPNDTAWTYCVKGLQLSCEP